MKPPTRPRALILAVIAFIASMPAPLNAAPAITSVAINPSSPTNTDSVTVTANVQPSAGSTLSQVQLTYSTGAVTTALVFQETFGNASTTSGFTGSVDLMNAWTATTTVNAGNVKLAGGTNNHTTPIVLTNCSTNTVNGTTTVTCTSNAGLIAGMSFSGSINGTSLAAGTTIASIPTSSTTTFVLSTPVSADGTVSNPTAAGVSLSPPHASSSPASPDHKTFGTPSKDRSRLVDVRLLIADDYF